MSQNNRKEKARIAARLRRSQEASIIMEMAQELHIGQEKLRRIDKATIVKLAIDYIKASEVLRNVAFVPEALQAQVISEQQETTTAKQVEGKRREEQLDKQEELRKEEERRAEIKAQSLFSAPKLTTTSIFAPKTREMNSHFLMIEKDSFVLKPDADIQDEDDLTHLAPQAGDISIPLDVEPLDGISLDDLLIVRSPVVPEFLFC